MRRSVARAPGADVVMPRLLLLAPVLLATTARGIAVGPWDSKMPDFSWDTLPVAYHGANYKAFSSASIALLAKVHESPSPPCCVCAHCHPCLCRGPSCGPRS